MTALADIDAGLRQPGLTVLNRARLLHQRKRTCHARTITSDKLIEAVYGRPDLSVLDRASLCLGAAIRIETQRAIPDIADIYSAGGCDEAMARLYAGVADIHVVIPDGPGPHGDPALDAILRWNDAPERTIDHVRCLAADVVTRCRAAMPIDLTGRRIFTPDLSQGGLVIETSRGVELRIKWDDEDEPVWWDIDEFEGEQALLLQISVDTLVRLDHRSVLRKMPRNRRGRRRPLQQSEYRLA